MTPLTRTLLVFALILAAFVAGLLLGGTFRTGMDLVSASGGKAGAAGAGASTDAAKADPAAKRETMIDAAEKRRLPWDKERLERAYASLAREHNPAAYYRRGVQLVDQLDLNELRLLVEMDEKLRGTGNNNPQIRDFAVARWAELAPEEAVKHFVKEDMYGVFLNLPASITWLVWGGNDPDAALACAKNIKSEIDRDAAIEAILVAIADKDPAKAIAYDKLFSTPNMRRNEFSRALTAATEVKDPEGAARLLLSIEPPSSDQYSGFREPMSIWAHKNFDAALAFAREIPNPDDRRTTALDAVYEVWIEKSLKEAAASILTEPRAGSDLTPLIARMALSWPADDLASASAWITQLPVKEERAVASSALASRIARENPEATAQWIATLSDTSVRDDAIAMIANQYAGKDGRAVVELALSMADPDRRPRATREAIQGWFSKDPAAAYDWLQNDPSLTPEQKRALLAK